MKELKVLTPFPYQGKMRKVGERINATNRHAAVLTLTGKTKEVKHRENTSEGHATRVMTSDHSSTAAPNRRARRNAGRGDGNYARSDMRPNTTGEELPTPQQGAE